MDYSVPPTPTIGIVGSQGAFGRWLARFFAERMRLPVIGRDRLGDNEMSEQALIDRADVLVFCVPIRATSALIDHYVSVAAGREAGKLWLDLTSIKAQPVAAMLRSHAEVVGLHPMTAPPKTPTLRGRAMVVCAARIDAWGPWLQGFLDATEAECTRAAPEHHDRIMALVQGMTHATHMAQAATLRELGADLGGSAAMHPFRTVGFELDSVVSRRMLAGNPAIYEDIQFENPHIPHMLDTLAAQIDHLRQSVARGDDSARLALRTHLLAQPREFYGAAALAEGNYGFERLGYLLGDLASAACLSVFLPLDRPGSLRALLSVFEELQINLDSIHSSRTPDGELHFRIGYDPATHAEKVDAARALIDARAIGRVLG